IPQCFTGLLRTVPIVACSNAALPGQARKILPMDTADFDVVILGAGPAGTALALALARKARNPARIALIGQQRPKAPSPGAGLAAGAGVEPRCMAHDHGRRVFLDTVSAWPPSAAEFRLVHVSRRQRLGRVAIVPRALQAPRLGNVVRYDDLLDTL